MRSRISEPADSSRFVYTNLLHTITLTIIKSVLRNYTYLLLVFIQRFFHFYQLHTSFRIIRFVPLPFHF